MRATLFLLFVFVATVISQGSSQGSRSILADGIAKSLGQIGSSLRNGTVFNCAKRVRGGEWPDACPDRFQSTDDFNCCTAGKLAVIIQDAFDVILEPVTLLADLAVGISLGSIRSVGCKATGVTAKASLGLKRVALNLGDMVQTTFNHTCPNVPTL